MSNGLRGSRRSSRCSRAPRGAGRERFLADRSLQREVERALELSIQACIDIGVHLVTAWGLGPPDDYGDAFEPLAAGASLDRDLAGG